MKNTLVIRCECKRCRSQVAFEVFYQKHPRYQIYEISSEAPEFTESDLKYFIEEFPHKTIIVIDSGTCCKGIHQCNYDAKSEMKPNLFDGVYGVLDIYGYNFFT